MSAMPRKLYSPPHYLWLFQVCEEECSEFARINDIPSAINSLYTPEWEIPHGIVAKLVSKPHIYSEVCKYLFSLSHVDRPIDVLQKHGYFVRGDSRILDPLSGFSPEKFVPVLECLMWAYIDRYPPKSQLLALTHQRSLSQITDAEQVICMWFNAITAKYSSLPTIRTIGNKFLGLPYLRIALFHFTLDEALHNTQDSADGNLRSCIGPLKDLGIPFPFDETVILQPPLLLLCFLCRAIMMLSSKPVKPRTKAVSVVHMSQAVGGVKMLKMEVQRLEKRCTVLNNEVAIIASKIPKRPASVHSSQKVVIPSHTVITPHFAPKPTVQKCLPPLPSQKSDVGDCMSEAGAERRVRWDPNVISIARASSLKNVDMSSV